MGEERCSSHGPEQMLEERTWARIGVDRSFSYTESRIGAPSAPHCGEQIHASYSMAANAG